MSKQERVYKDQVTINLEHHDGPGESPPAIALNRTFADGSRLELRVSGGEALALYYEWLWWDALEREGD